MIMIKAAPIEPKCKMPAIVNFNQHHQNPKLDQFDDKSTHPNTIITNHHLSIQPGREHHPPSLFASWDGTSGVIHNSYS